MNSATYQQIAIGDHIFSFQENSNGCRIASSIPDTIVDTDPAPLSEGHQLFLVNYLYRHTWSTRHYSCVVRTCDNPLCINPRHLAPMNGWDSRRFRRLGSQYLAEKFGIDPFGNTAFHNGPLTRGTGSILAAHPTKGALTAPTPYRRVKAGPLTAIVVGFRGSDVCYTCRGFWDDGFYRIKDNHTTRAPIPAALLRWCDIHGPIPSGMRLIQDCGNPYCLNRQHMFLIPEAVAPDFYYKNPSSQRRWVSRYLAEERSGKEAPAAISSLQGGLAPAVADDIPFPVTVTTDGLDYVAAVPGLLSAKGPSRPAAIAELEALVTLVKDIHI